MEGAHWRKAWPEGDTDNSEEDSPVIDRFLAPEPPKAPHAEHRWIPYEPHTNGMGDENTGYRHINQDLF